MLKARLIKKNVVQAIVRAEISRHFATPKKGECAMWLVTKAFTIKRLHGKLASNGHHFVPSCGNYPALMVNSQVFKSATKAKAKAAKLAAIAAKRFSY